GKNGFSFSDIRIFERISENLKQYPNPKSEFFLIGYPNPKYPNRSDKYPNGSDSDSDFRIFFAPLCGGIVEES
ncbi:hypothetical protein PSY31_22945, partial [Shigella flexneri]|nr:hypothetical protein [Shigella flexneri]